MELIYISSKLCSAIKEMENFYKKIVKFWNGEKQVILLNDNNKYGILIAYKEEAEQIKFKWEQIG